MQEAPEQKQFAPIADDLSWREFFAELVQGFGKMAGLGLLWALEAVRNLYFRTLDALSIKARPNRRVSAFPPGSPRSPKAS